MLFKNKKGSAFIESLLFAPIMIFLVVMIASRIIILTQSSSNNNSSRTILRECITCSSATNSNSPEHTLLNTLKNKSEEKLFLSEIRIINSLNNSILESVSFENIPLNEVSDSSLKYLNEYWEKGNILELDLYFSIMHVFSDDVLAMGKFNPIPNGAKITVRGVIENDIF